MFDSTRQVPAGEGYRSTPPEVAGPVTPAPRPIPVVAWVIDRDGRDQLVRGKVTAWTARTVRFSYLDERGRLGCVWLWASAVVRDDPPPAPRYRSKRSLRRDEAGPRP